MLNKIKIKFSKLLKTSHVDLSDLNVFSLMITRTSRSIVFGTTRREGKF